MAKIRMASPKNPEEAFSEAKEYFNNAKEILKNIPIEWGAYTKPKFVKEASAMGYLAGMRAIDAYLLSIGISPDKLPASITEYEKSLKKIPHNGKLMTALNIVYQNLHIFGYYRGGISVEMIKDGFQKAKFIIDTLSSKNIRVFHRGKAPMALPAKGGSLSPRPTSCRHPH